MSLRNTTAESTSNRGSRAFGGLVAGNSIASWLFCSVLAAGCGDGIARPIRANGSSTGSPAQGSAGSTSVGSNGGAGLGGPEGNVGPGGNVGLDDPGVTRGRLEDAVLNCSAVAEVEQDLLTVLNALRLSGTACAGSSGVWAQRLAMSGSLHCLARLRSQAMSEGTWDLPSEPLTEITLVSEPLATLDVPAFLEQIVQSGGVNCQNLLGPHFSVVGIGFAESGDLTQGYWTIYLVS